MTDVNHVTYEVPPGQTRNVGLDLLFTDLLRMKEVEPDERIEGGWTVRWWEDAHGFQVHVVENERLKTWRSIGLAHFCVYVPWEAYVDCTASGFNTLSRSESQDRLWLEGPVGLRVEVCPASRPPASSLPGSVETDRPDEGSSTASDDYPMFSESADQ